jgi:hypothetical protein
MMDKLFVNYEIAKQLKEKGFDEPCFGYYYPYYYTDRIHFEGSSGIVKSACDKNLALVKAPLYQQVVDWFEEKHNIHISRGWYDDNVTPPRWIYHVEKQYAPDFNTAIKNAIQEIKL